MANKKDQSGDLLQGTLDLLILKSLARGPMHGYGVAEWIHDSSQRYQFFTFTRLSRSMAQLSR